VWQSKEHKGLGIKEANGALCWADLSTNDADKAAAFYQALFGWEIEQGNAKASGYRHIQNGEAMIGGIPPASHRNPNVPPHWLAYFQVGDCDATAASATSMGAKLLLPPMSMENVGRIAVIADPQGAVFALFQPVPQPT
jgi:predicted enzyme related to lactoylglutathione lyase